MERKEWDKPGRDVSSYIMSAAVAWCVLSRSEPLLRSPAPKGCGRGTGGDGAWQAGPQRCPRLSEGDGDGDGGGIIDCTAVALNYASIKSMEEAAGAQVTFLRSDYSRLLHRPLLFHTYAVALPPSFFFPAWSYGSIIENSKTRIWENVWGVKMWGF